MKRSLRSWLWSVPLDREVDEEIAFHLEMRTRELIDRGVDPKVAREMALARLGDVTRLRRECLTLGRKREREMRITQWLEERGGDVRFALRQLRRAPAFTIVAVVTLALGIGANSAMFALADAALLRPLPFTTPPERLVMLWDRYANGFRSVVTPLDYADWSEQTATMDAVAAVVPSSITITGADGAAEAIATQSVTGRFFDVLGVTPVAGRTFLPSDAPSATVVLSESLWRERFAGDTSIIGRTVVFGGRPQTIVGVIPDRFQMIPPAIGDAARASDAPRLWTLFETPRAGGPWLRASHYLWVIGRIKAGVSLTAAQADFSGLAARNAERYPETNTGHGIFLQPLREVLIGGELRLTSMLLFGIVGFVLLMCCANVANLLLAHTASRGRELAVRSALGASRRRVTTQLLTESLVLASLGGAAGIGIGAAILRAAPVVIPPDLLPNAVRLTFDGRVVTFCALTALLVGVLFGLAPLWQSTSRSLIQALTAEGRAMTRGGRLRQVLVAAEVAAAVLVLTGAGLLVRTLLVLQQVDPGYRAHDVLTMAVNLPMPNGNGVSAYPTPVSVKQYYDAVQREVERIPGVRTVAWGSAMPLDGTWFGMGVGIEGDPVKPQANRDAAAYHIVSPEYFQALDIPIVRGRGFTDADTGNGRPVCVVSEAFVRRFLGGRDPIGMRVLVGRMTFGTEPVPAREIVGIVRHVKGRPNETEPFPQVYVPLSQNPWWAASLVVRTAGVPAEQVAAPVRAAAARVDKARPLTRVRTIDAIAWQATERPRFRAALVAAFAGLALTLAVVGVFGVLAYAVQQRTREFGVRVALGASVGDVMTLVARSAARVTIVGLAVGLAAAAIVGRWIAGLLFGVPPLDPVTFTAVAVVMAITAAAAAAAPAWRAARVDPAVTFRSE